MSADAEQPGKVVLDCDLDAPPEKVWRALTEPHLVAAWLIGGDIADRVECEVLTADPPRLVSYSWREVSEAPVRESVITFAISPSVSGGTHLRLVHDGAPLLRGHYTYLRSRLRRPSGRERDKYSVPVIAPTTMRWAA